MNSVQVYLLGRKLMRLAERSFPAGAPGGAPNSVRMVLSDVSEHPDSSIGEITARTGFPQSHVSTAVARLRALGVVETATDAGDGRRTLVRVNQAVRDRHARAVAGPIDPVLADELGDPAALAEVTEALELLARRLIPGALTHTSKAEGSGSRA